VLARIDALEKKLDALVTTPAPQPEPAKRRVRAPKAPPSPPAAPTPAAATEDDVVDGEDHDFVEEDTLRAQTEFELKRVSRQFGVSAGRAVIKRVAGDDVLRIDDVPPWQMPLLLAKLRAL